MYVLSGLPCMCFVLTYEIACIERTGYVIVLARVYVLHCYNYVQVA